MASIDYYLVAISPYCYLAGDRLEQIAAKHGASVTYKPIDMLQLMDRIGGIRPANRHISRIEYRSQELTRWSELLQMPINLKPAHFPVNMAPASYAIIAAQKAGGGDLAGLVQGFMRAVWAEERDISDDAVIRDILENNGFDPSLTDSGLLIGAETYGRNLDQAVEYGVFGAPFYIVQESGQRFWGQDRLEFLDRHLASL